MLKIDQYAYINGLKHVHPAEKVAFAFVFLLFTIITKNKSIACLTFFIMSISVVFAAKIPLSQYIKLLLLPSMFLLTSMMTIVISVTSINSYVNPLWQIEIGSWSIYTSLANLKQAFDLGTTVIASISCLYFLILTTSINQILWVLKQLKLPILFIELVGMTYRFIFVLLDKMHEIFLAQSSRLGYQNHKDWITSVAQLIVSLFIKSSQSAKELQTAIESRGGEEGLYDIEIGIAINRSRCAGILVVVVGLFTISILTR